MTKTFTEKSGQVWNLELMRSTEHHAIVTFYDGDYANFKSFGPLGQKVSEYYVKTLLGEDGFSGRPQAGMGLNLHGGEPKWSVSGQVMDQVRAWLRENR